MGWRRYFRRARWDPDRREEIESYIQIETEDNIAAGSRRTKPALPRAANSGTPHGCGKRSIA